LTTPFKAASRQSEKHREMTPTAEDVFYRFISLESFSSRSGLDVDHRV
jgi:hypothetical protein